MTWTTRNSCPQLEIRVRINAGQPIRIVLKLCDMIIKHTIHVYSISVRTFRVFWWRENEQLIEIRLTLTFSHRDFCRMICPLWHRATDKSSTWIDRHCCPLPSWCLSWPPTPGCAPRSWSICGVLPSRTHERLPPAPRTLKMPDLHGWYPPVSDPLPNGYHRWNRHMDTLGR